jgi:hypothetical protein
VDNTTKVHNICNPSLLKMLKHNCMIVNLYGTATSVRKCGKCHVSYNLLAYILAVKLCRILKFVQGCLLFFFFLFWRDLEGMTEPVRD